MGELTAAIREELKAKWGADLRVLSSVVETDDGDETISLVVRRPSLEDYDDVTDAHTDAAGVFETIQNAVIKYAVWPPQAELASVFDMDPTIAAAAWGQMSKMCGAIDGGIEELHPGALASLTVEEKAAAGITDEMIASWKAADRRRMCRVFRTPLGIWVCRRPGQSAYGSYRRLRDQKKISAAFRGLVAECSVWPNEDRFASQMEKQPAIVLTVGVFLAQASEKAQASSGGI